MTALVSILLASGLYEQAVSRVLAQRFAATEYLLVDAQSGRVVARNWADVHAPVPVGSLLKPFLAAALSHDRESICEPGRCWLPRGHGRVRMADAIAWSCNRWFVLNGGLNPDARIAPDTLVRDYLRTVAHPNVREGMRRAVTEGTAVRLRIEALAKTGTAACSHSKRASGDGLVVALWPEQQPQYLLLVRVHGTTGAVAAGTAGEILRTVRDGK